MICVLHTVWEYVVPISEQNVRGYSSIDGRHVVCLLSMAVNENRDTDGITSLGLLTGSSFMQGLNSRDVLVPLCQGTGHFWETGRDKALPAFNSRGSIAARLHQSSRTWLL